MSSEPLLRLPSAQREALSGTRQTVVAAAVLMIAVTGLTLLRVGSLGALELAALAMGALYIVGMLVGGRALARAQALDGADAAALVAGLRWLGLALVCKALGLLLLTAVMIGQYKSFRP